MADGLNQANKIGEAFFEVSATGTETAKKAVDSVRTSLDAAGVSGERMAQKTATGVSGFTQQISFFNNQITDSVTKIGLLTNGVHAVAGMTQGAFGLGQGIGNFAFNQAGQERELQRAMGSQDRATAKSTAQQTSQDEQVYFAAGIRDKEAVDDRIARKNKNEAERAVLQSDMEFIKKAERIASYEPTGAVSAGVNAFRAITERSMDSNADEAREFTNLNDQRKKIENARKAVFAQGFERERITSTFEAFDGLSIGQAGQTEILRQIAQQGAFPSGPR